MAATSEDVSAEEAELKQYVESKKDVPRMTLPDEAKTIIVNGRYGVISTISSKKFGGYPLGGVVQYVASPDDGMPLFYFSTLTDHRGNVEADKRASLTVTADNFQGVSDARFNLVGDVERVPDSERAAAREQFLKAFPEAFYVDFGDFAPFKFTKVVGGRLNGGFGRAGDMTEQKYKDATPDPVAQFAGPVCKHMNDDHMDATIAIVKEQTGLTATKAELFRLDQFGMDVMVTHTTGQTLRCRITFKEPATDRKAVKERIV